MARGDPLPGAVWRRHPRLLPPAGDAAPPRLDHPRAVPPGPARDVAGHGSGGASAGFIAQTLAAGDRDPGTVAHPARGLAAYRLHLAATITLSGPVRPVDLVA